MHAIQLAPFPTATLDDHDVHQLVPVQRMPPAASPFITVPHLARRGRGHPANMVQHQSARYHQPGLFGVSSLTKGVRTIEETLVNHLIGYAVDNVGVQQ